MRLTFIITILFFFNANIAAASENPFMKMAGKQYAEYSRELQTEFEKHWFPRDTLASQEFIRQIEEVAQKTGSLEWALRAEYFELSLFEFYKPYGKASSYEEQIKCRMDLLERTQKANIITLELQLLSDFIVCYCDMSSIKNYELALEYCELLNQRMQGISPDEIPEISHYYNQIGDVHYYFKDYSTAIFYFEKTLNYKETESNQWYRQGALNTMGHCYRYGFNDLDRSDSCFYAILQTQYFRYSDEEKRETWEGIAEGNIGRNMILRKEYDNAIPLLKSSIEKTIKINDYAYATLPTINLAIIYIQKNNLSEAKRYIDSATIFYSKAPRSGNLSLIYEAKSKYYAATGNAALSMAYMDSTLAENNRLQEQFNAVQMMRVEQRKYLSEQKLKNEQLNDYRRSLIIIITSLLLISILFLRYIILYRKKKTAYRELVRKSQEWAAVDIDKIETQYIAPLQQTDEQEDKIQNVPPDDIDFSIMHNIEKLITEEKLYLDSTLTLESLSQKLNITRHYVSAAINHCTQKGFNTLINEYRIKEAIKIMSKKDAKNLSIDQITFDVGFNNRINFYRVFKKIVGLSPTEFRRNVESK
ncbi:MAG: helix-turn-helix domain-containing protein [Prevotellaceae bacterium]|jgi:AraC-like DNA-binding protein|nr:helix-turn-helix domain-containing protein [Prevotellaceae bacterium]